MLTSGPPFSVQMGHQGILFILSVCILATCHSQWTQDSFNARPPNLSSRPLAPQKAATDEELPVVFEPLTNSSDPGKVFNDSAMIEEFNEGYVQRMFARTAAIALNADLVECVDSEESCSSWAQEGYCFSNAGYMSIACPRSCDVCDLATCADNHMRCSEWAGKGECSSNPSYMLVACRESCGVCGDKAPAPSILPPEATTCHEEETNYQGRVESVVENGVESWPACSAICETMATCKAWVWVKSDTGPYSRNCALMEGFSNRAPDPNTVAGPRGCKAPGSTESFTPGGTTEAPTTTTLAPTTKGPGGKGCQEESTNYQGREGATVQGGVQSWEACSKLCEAREEVCKSWVWVKPNTGDYSLNCALMEGFSNRAQDPNTVAGPRGCGSTRDTGAKAGLENI